MVMSCYANSMCVRAWTEETARRDETGDSISNICPLGATDVLFKNDSVFDELDKYNAYCVFRSK